MKLNVHGHEWQMRVTEHAKTRYAEFRVFCDAVKLYREKNDERAEYERTKALKENPTSSCTFAASLTLAEVTGGGDYNEY